MRHGHVLRWMRVPKGCAALALGMAVGLGCSTSPPATTVTPSSSRQSPVAETTSSAAARPLGGPGCSPESPWVDGNLGPDRIGTVRPASVPLFARMPDPVHAGLSEKLIWRMGGTGPLSIYAEHTDGTRVSPVSYGPHSGSTWNRPGDEWGSDFLLPRSGCWRFHLARTDAEGDIWIVVAI